MRNVCQHTKQANNNKIGLRTTFPSTENNTKLRSDPELQWLGDASLRRVDAKIAFKSHFELYSDFKNDILTNSSPNKLTPVTRAVSYVKPRPSPPSPNPIYAVPYKLETYKLENLPSAPKARSDSYIAASSPANLNDALPYLTIDEDLMSSEDEDEQDDSDLPKNRRRESVEIVAWRWGISDELAKELMQNVEERNPNTVWVPKDASYDPRH